ncbi:DUF4124 domain-containing protein [Shewanella cyperi]|uniref:DUF4124 domain-containing protein n=1 Tax=Shewanella cyperi TaxID=2814292 RepID=A0A974XLG4_9GAMM|nr:DUF4124 domain-containing protein [Shewanella cyperi]QSX29201.1 DUF4124 domain-containing protein [Shewanella cyperi]QSX39947.1 DUF4124 domain-containing protein [Shewanella cyperi]
MFARTPIALLLLSMLSGATWATTIYTWVDEKGVTHYSEQPPTEEQTGAKTLYSEDIEPGKVGSVAPKARERKPEMTEDEKKAAILKIQNEEKAKEVCEDAKRRLDILTSYARIRQTKEGSDEPVVLSEEEKQQATAETRKTIELYCKE